MEASLELSDLGLASMGAHQTNGVHHCFGAGVDEPHLLYGWDSFADVLGYGFLVGVWCAKDNAVVHYLVQCCDNAFWAVAKDHGAGVVGPVNVLMSVYIPHVAVLSPVNIQSW